MYNQRSKEYINPYKGTLNTGSLIPPSHIYPEKYCYWYPCANPKNDYEFCYCRRNTQTQSLDNMDLYTFNFCTGEITFLAQNVCGWPDWSVKNWIIFTGTDRNLWKIKNNGDSLTQLTNTGNDYSAKWSPNGELYFWNSTKVANENGDEKFTVSHCGSFLGWYDNSTILNVYLSSSYISKINISNNEAENYAPTHGYSYNTFIRNSNEFLGATDSIVKYKKNLIFNVSNNTIKFLNPSFNPQSFLTNLHSKIGNKILLQQNLRDTMTGDPTLINFRSHIAIMDLDGKNERQVLIPE
jgi:hypothetical protein